MHLFARPHYTSDITNFINEMKAQRPSLEAEQRAGRALLWDKHVDREAAEQQRQAAVAQQAYVYQTHSQ